MNSLSTIKLWAVEGGRTVTGETEIYTIAAGDM